MSTIFSKIISGEIPSHKVYEDERTYAFLDINPRQEGHTLVVPRREVDYIFDLPSEDYEALWKAVERVATALKAVTHCERVVVLVVGYEVPHVHVHLIPTNELADIPFPPIDEDARQRLAETAEKIHEVIH
ncbi:MAG TPA: HIT family protein [Acidimicrobiia bacterium]|nr:HIT family protein [Acidimicrobiia bacterium]